MAERLDVIVVGAGLSGIGAGCWLKTRCPDTSYAILEARAVSGGTWDLFRYPGVRSDSDMFTFGYSFKPWPGQESISDGPSILRYIRQTAREGGIDPKIRYQHRVLSAQWSSADAQWTLQVERGPEREQVQLHCRFLYVCTGYYRYDAGYTPELPGIERFRGRVVHPQHWSEDIDYAGKRVVVIGSGATAMTLVPALAEQAAHVVMLQRSPTYVVSVPARDRSANLLRRILPMRVATGITRWKQILIGLFFFNLMRRWPAFAKRQLVAHVRRALGPSYDVERHFSPRYGVWDQRLCLVPDGSLFAALRSGRASVVTDSIEGFSESGIVLKSGRALDADLVITATGLQMLFAGGIALEVDGQPIEPGRALAYKGCMLCNVPNFAFTLGYTNASWTLRAELTAEFVCRVLRALDAAGATHCVPRSPDPGMQEHPFMALSSGYVQRGMPDFPKQGDREPYQVLHNYARDLLALRYAAIEDGTLELRTRVPRMGGDQKEHDRQRGGR